MHCSPRTYTHIITSAAVDLAAREIEAALLKGGYDPSGLDFGPPAAQRLVDEAVAAATDLGIAVTRRGWSRSADGGADVAIEVARELDLPLLKVALS